MPIGLTRLDACENLFNRFAELHEGVVIRWLTKKTTRAKRFDRGAILRRVGGCHHNHGRRAQSSAVPDTRQYFLAGSCRKVQIEKEKVWPDGIVVCIHAGDRSNGLFSVSNHNQAGRDVTVCDRFLNQESVGRIVLDQCDQVSM